MKGTGRPTFGGPSELEPGMQLWLYPNTRAASRACWLGLAAEIVETPTTTWPLVRVRHEEGEELVHRNNLRSSPPGFVAKKKEGDGTNNNVPEVRVKPAFRPHPPLSPGDYEESMLF